MKKIREADSLLEPIAKIFSISITELIAGNPEVRFKINGVKKIFFYCNRDGLFSIDVDAAIDGRENAYDDTVERRELEQAAKMLFR